MNKQTFNELVEEYLERCKSVLQAKDAEYSSETDRLHNFVMAGKYKSESPREALFGMLVKHWVSIADMCQSGKHYPEALWDEKLVDNINYTLLLKALLRDEKVSKVDMVIQFDGAMFEQNIEQIKRSIERGH